MTSRQAEDTVAGSTQASSVIAVVSCSELALGTFTRASVPLKLSASPNLPAVDQVVFDVAASLPLPEESVTLVPLPSSNEYAATSPVGAPLLEPVVAVSVLPKAPWLPALSTARTLYE